jgi:hypothetical protein
VLPECRAHFASNKALIFPSDRTFVKMFLLCMKTALVVAAVWLFGVCCFAGDATFSRDGKRVYTIESTQKKAAVREIDLTNETQRVIPLPDCGVRLDGIAQSEDEKIYCPGRENPLARRPDKRRRQQDYHRAARLALLARRLQSEAPRRICHKRS